MAARAWDDNKQSIPAAFPLTAADLWHEMESRAFIIPTGCDNLDELLEGGLYSGEVTELCGAPGVGKTQLCYSVTLETSKGSTNTVAYLSTNCSFNASRLSSMHMLTCHNNIQLDTEDVMERIRCYAVGDIFEALQVLSGIQHKIASQHDTFHSQIRLIVIDNITILISPLLGGAQFEGHAIMNHLAIYLTKLAQDYCLIVLVVNNTVTNMLDDIKPALGNSWAHVPSTRLMLYYGNGKERIGSIVKSSRQRSGVNTSYYITDTGLAISYQ